MENYTFITPFRIEDAKSNRSNPIISAPFGCRLNENWCKTDNNRIINEKYIRWVKKMDECLDVCMKSTGCNKYDGSTHKICKINNPDSYNKLNKHFE